MLAPNMLLVLLDDIKALLDQHLDVPTLQEGLHGLDVGVIHVEAVVGLGWIQIVGAVREADVEGELPRADVVVVFTDQLCVCTDKKVKGGPEGHKHACTRKATHRYLAVEEL